MSDSEHGEVEEVHDAEIVDEGGEPTPVVEAREVSTDLTVRPPSGNEVLMPLDTEQVVAGMKAYQELLPKLLEPSDWQDAGSDGKFVKKSGWRKIARAFNLSVMVVSVRIERDAEGNPTRAETIARAMGPNGQVSDADGYCSADEKRFKNERGRQKLENDLRATATTRAKNRAISDLVGMGEVSAEEVEPGGGSGLTLATDEQQAKLNAALTYLIDGHEQFGNEAWKAITAAFGGSLYGEAVEAVAGVIRAYKGFRELQAEAEAAERETPPGDPPPSGGGDGA
jgi:hypothetical protein